MVVIAEKAPVSSRPPSSGAMHGEAGKTSEIIYSDVPYFRKEVFAQKLIYPC